MSLHGSAVEHPNQGMERHSLQFLLEELEHLSRSFSPTSNQFLFSSYNSTGFVGVRVGDVSFVQVHHDQHPTKYDNMVPLLIRALGFPFSEFPRVTL